MPSRRSTSSSPITTRSGSDMQTLPYPAELTRRRSGGAERCRGARPWARSRRRPSGGRPPRWPRRSPRRSARRAGCQGSAESRCASANPSPSGRPMSTSTASGRSSVARSTASANVPASPTTARPQDRRVLVARCRKLASSSTTRTDRDMAPSSQRIRRADGRASPSCASGQWVWRRERSRWTVPCMPQQLIATMTPPASRAGSPGRGTVHSIELARRRLRRSTPRDDIRVLVVGSHAITRAGLRRLLEDDHGLAVVGEAASGRDAARMARSTDPDVVLLDAGCFEPELAASVRLLAGRVAVLLLTEYDAGRPRPRGDPGRRHRRAREGQPPGRARLGRAHAGRRRSLTSPAHDAPADH